MSSPSAKRVASRHLAAKSPADDVYDELLALWKREFPRGRGHKGRAELEFEVREVFKSGDPMQSVDPYEYENEAKEAKWTKALLRAMKSVLTDRKRVKKHEFMSEGNDFTLRVELA